MHSPLLFCTSVIFLLFTFVPLNAAERGPVARDARLVHHGEIGAGEGPAWHPDGFLLFTGGGRITKRDAQGNVNVFREDSGGANGLLIDPQHRLIVCESGRRRVTRTELDGSITVLADNYRGARFNTPNDLTIDSKGRIYFTDPRYGPRDTMEMRDEKGQLVEGVYRIDGPGRVTRIITRELQRPNGILVSADDKYLYVADNNNNTIAGARQLWRFRLGADGSINPRSRKLIFDWQAARGPDGFKMDERGRLYVAAGSERAEPALRNCGQTSRRDLHPFTSREVVALSSYSPRRSNQLRVRWRRFENVVHHCGRPSVEHPHRRTGPRSLQIGTLLNRCGFRLVGLRCCAATHDRQVVRHQSRIAFGNCYGTSLLRCDVLGSAAKNCPRLAALVSRPADQLSLAIDPLFFGETATMHGSLGETPSMSTVRRAALQAAGIFANQVLFRIEKCWNLSVAGAHKTAR